MTIFYLPKQVAVTSAGIPLSFSKLYFYKAGTTTDQTVYTDFALTTPHAQPVVADALGVFPTIYLNPAAPVDYRVQLKSFLSSLIYDQDNYPKSGVSGVTIFSTFIRYDQTLAEATALVTPTNYYYPPGKIARYMSASQLADWLTGTQSVDQKTAIDTALSVGGSIDASGKFFTSGGHVISTQNFTGDGKATTSFKQKSGGADVMFQLTSTGSINDLNLDGNSQPGTGLQVTTGQNDYLVGVASRVEIKNWGGSITTVNVTAVSKNTTTTMTVSANPSTINVAAGTLVRVRAIGGILSAGNASKTPLDGVFKVLSVTSTTIVVDVDTSLGYTAYTTGGTVEKANYALRVDQATGDFVSWTKQFKELTFRSNYGHIFLGYSLYINFNNTICVGGTSDFAVYASNLDCEYVTFRGFFAQSGIRTAPYAVRGLKFEDAQFILLGWNAPVYESQGLNEAFGNANGEIAKTKFINTFIQRNYSAASFPLFKTNNTDMTIEGLSIVETGSTNWTVFDDTGTVNCRIQDVSVESTNAWDMFTATPSYGSAGGYSTLLENVNHFQGTGGTITLSSAKYATKVTSFITLRNSDCNVKINAVNAGADRGYYLQNIQGNIDLTNSSVGGTVLQGYYGTVTDPNGALTLGVSANGTEVTLNCAILSLANPTLGNQAGHIYQINGVPNNANGNNGDICFRTDTPGTVNQRIYIKAAGAWAGIV